MSTSQALIVADIGGTNARFALASQDEGGATYLEEIRVYEDASSPHLEAVVQRYLDDLQVADCEHSGRVCLAIAGPNDGRSGFMVNRGWRVDAGRVEQHCNLQQVLLVNDFEALSAGVPGLQDSDVEQLKGGQPVHGPICVVGPGTGLGVGMLVPDEAGYRVVGTEGGHMSYVPVRPLERDLSAYLAPEGEYLAAEDVLCGQGLVRIQWFLNEREHTGTRLDHPSEVTRGALEDADRVCLQSVALFLASLGSHLGDIALVQGAVGGVYLGGGVLPRLLPLLHDSDLITRFLDKGPLREFNDKIPVYLITADHVALRGAASLFELRQGS